MIGNNFTVYKHTSPNGKVYIGITMQNPIRRWNNGLGYSHNEHFHRAIVKYGWDNFKHEILYSGLTKEEAEQTEISLIAEYKSNDPEYGYNIQSGGNYSGKHSDETRKKFSEISKGRKVSEISKRKMSDAHVVKRIVQLSKNGEIIAIWNGCKTAGKALNIPYQNISECVKGKGYRKSAGGYLWRYENNGIE